MRVNTILPVAAVVASTASAKTITVDVGKDGLTFSPDMITASKGDMLSFHFYPRKHSVVLGTMDKACSPATSGMFYSGFIPSSDGEAKDTFEVMVNSTDTMYIYCSAAQHCQDGMVGVINGSKDDLSKYKDAAAKASDNVSPDAVAGGMVMSGGASSMSMSMTSGSSMSSTMMSDSSMSSMMSSMSSGSSMMSSGSATPTSGGAAGSSTSGSGAASSTPTDKPAAAPAGFKASVAGVLAAAGGVAALML